MATYAQFKHVELYKIGHGKNRVPNAPKSCISEIFNCDAPKSPVQQEANKPRVVRDTPTRPRDTHSRLFGQAALKASNVPLVTDTTRSNIQFADLSNGHAVQSPGKLTNGSSSSSTPCRGEVEAADN